MIAGNAGILVTRVEYVKRTGKKNFIIVDAAMNDLIRPAFYDAYHEIVPLKQKPGVRSSRRLRDRSLIPSDVVGPVCESGDVFTQDEHGVKDREISKVSEGDVLAICNAGAYGFSMASRYNSRPLLAEVLVRDGKASVINKRETFEDLTRGQE